MFDAIQTGMQHASEDAKAASVDAIALAILAGIIGMLAYLTTSDVLNSKELSLPKALTITSMSLVLLKMALYIDSSNVRRAVRTILTLVYLAPFCLEYYLYHEECPEKNTLVTTIKCMLDLHAPKDEHQIAPIQFTGQALILLFSLIVMVFSFRIATWRRFLGLRDSGCVI